MNSPFVDAGFATDAVIILNPENDALDYFPQIAELSVHITATKCAETSFAIERIQKIGRKIVVSISTTLIG
jgi:hypothetical protein